MKTKLIFSLAFFVATSIVGQLQAQFAQVGPNLEYTGGKVSIGTTNINTNTDYGLYVADGILTEQVRVAIDGSNEWADFVFEEGYELRSLEELEGFINEHGHLPEIPSAQEVSDGGLNLAEMDANLLQKVEELSLYIIELNKKIEQLEAAVSIKND